MQKILSSLKDKPYINSGYVKLMTNPFITSPYVIFFGSVIQQTDYPALDRLIYSLDTRFTTYTTSHLEESYQTPASRV